MTVFLELIISAHAHDSSKNHPMFAPLARWRLESAHKSQHQVLSHKFDPNKVENICQHLLRTAAGRWPLYVTKFEAFGSKYIEIA